MKVGQRGQRWSQTCYCHLICQRSQWEGVRGLSESIKGMVYRSSW